MLGELRAGDALERELDRARTEAARVELERLKQEMNGRLIPGDTDRVDLPARTEDTSGIVVARG